MKIRIKEDLKEQIEELEKKGKMIKSGLPVVMFKILTRIEAAAKENIRTRMKVRTGTLLNSVQKDIDISRNSVVGSIGPENVPYAAIQEFGGELPAIFIKPRNVKALRWIQGGKTFFSKGHLIPPRKIPAKRYLRDAVDDNIEKARNDFELFINVVMEGNA